MGKWSESPVSTLATMARWHSAYSLIRCSSNPEAITNATRDQKKRMKNFVRKLGSIFCFAPVLRRCTVTIAPCSLRNHLFQTRWRANRGPDISVVFAQLSRSYSTFSQRTPLCLVRRTFNNWRSFAAWCATSTSRQVLLQCLRCATTTAWHAARAISI